jgi:hypothetical protein
MSESETRDEWAYSHIHIFDQLLSMTGTDLVEGNPLPIKHKENKEDVGVMENCSVAGGSYSLGISGTYWHVLKPCRQGVSFLLRCSMHLHDLMSFEFLWAAGLRCRLT